MSEAKFAGDLISQIPPKELAIIERSFPVAMRTACRGLYQEGILYALCAMNKMLLESRLPRIKVIENVARCKRSIAELEARLKIIAPALHDEEWEAIGSLLFSLEDLEDAR